MASESSGGRHDGAMPPSLLLLAALAVMSVVAAATFAWDKRRARAGARRVPEARLLGLALCGGGCGAWWAMQRVRHKTRHLRFRLLVPLFALAQLALLAWLAWRDLRAA